MNAAHKLLRDATSARHGRVDAAFSVFNLGMRDGYRNFLAAQAAAYLPVEAALENAGASQLLSDWASRKRGAVLLDDMRMLGLKPDLLQPEPVFRKQAGMWGAFYVVEGSRLGGRVLAKSVPPGLPTAFLLHTVQKSAWRSLLDQLDRALANEVDRKEAVVAARTVFDLFENAAIAVRKVCVRE